MNLESITNLPFAPSIEKEKDTSDCRYKMVLLHRERDTYTVLAIPYGTDLRARIEVPSAVYLKSGPRITKYKTINDPTITLHKKKNYQYPMFETEGFRRVIPFKTKLEFPENYTDNTFYSMLQEQMESLFKLSDVLFSYFDLEDTSFLGMGKAVAELSKKAREDRQTKEKFEDYVKLSKKLLNEFNPRVYNLIEELFSDEENPSTNMARFERKFKHWIDKDFIIPPMRKGGIKGYLSYILKSGLTHPFLTSLEKRNCVFKDLLKTENSRNRAREQFSAIAEMYPRLFNTLKNINDHEDQNTSKRFRNLLIIGGLATMPFNVYAGLGIIGLGITDRIISKRHAKNYGTHTSLIGQIRDHFTKEELRNFYLFDIPKKGYLI
jgi:hypothetical protein